MWRTIEDALVLLLLFVVGFGFPLFVGYVANDAEKERAQDIQRHEEACHKRGLISFEETDREGRSATSFWFCIDPKTNQVFWPVVKSD